MIVHSLQSFLFPLQPAGTHEKSILRILEPGVFRSVAALPDSVGLTARRGGGSGTPTGEAVLPGAGGGEMAPPAGGGAPQM